VDGIYQRAAQVLRLLAINDQPTQLAGSDDPMRSILRTAANACEQVEELSQAPVQALARVADLEDLLARVADAIQAEPLPAEGGSWILATLLEEIRRALNKHDRD
jgi:hypothetical protein